MRLRQNTGKSGARLTGKQKSAERVVIAERNLNGSRKEEDDVVKVSRSLLGSIGSRILSPVMEARGRLEIRWGAKRPRSSLVDRV